MTISEFIFKMKRKIKRAISYAVQYPRILKYKLLSDCRCIIGKPIYNCPVQLCGGEADSV